MRTRHAKKLLSSGLVLLALVSVWYWFAPAQLGGSTTFVVTNGTSMEPRFHTGDLALVRPQSTYHVGEIVAYNSRVYHTIVLHRIIAMDGSRYVFKGDNNNFVDFEHPARSQLIGSLWLHVPGMGSWLESIRSPLLLGVLIALAVLLFSGVAFTRDRRRRRRERRAQDSAPRPPRSLPRLPSEAASGVWAIGAVAMLPFVLLGLLALTRASSSRQAYRIPYTQTGKLSYSAQATPGPAYEGNEATTGEPLFTHVLHDVSFTFDYMFLSSSPHSVGGRAWLAATLTSSSGWHSSLQLGHPTYFRGAHANVAATLDIDSMMALLHTVNQVTGVGGDYTLTLTPTVRLTGSLAGEPLLTRFAPPVQFNVEQGEIIPDVPAEVAGVPPANGSAFNPVVQGIVSGQRSQSRSLSFGVVRVSVMEARVIALAGILAIIGLTYVLSSVTRTRESDDEAASIHARYGGLIIPVERVFRPPGSVAIDVPDIESLVRVAEHYDRSILHENSPSGEFFWVADESGHFRYTVGAAAPSPSFAPEAAAPAGEEPPSQAGADEYSGRFAVGSVISASRGLEPAAPPSSAVLAAWSDEPRTLEHRTAPDAGREAPAGWNGGVPGGDPGPVI